MVYVMCEVVTISHTLIARDVQVADAAVSARVHHADALVYVTCRWLTLQSQREFITLTLSSSACEMLMVLKDHLHCADTLLARRLFHQTWTQVAAHLNDFILNYVSSGSAVANSWTAFSA